MGCYFFHINFNRKYAIPWTRPEPVLRSLARPLHRTWRVFLTWTSVRRVWFCHWKGCGLRLQGCRELIERNSWLKIKGNFFFLCLNDFPDPSLMAVHLLWLSDCYHQKGHDSGDPSACLMCRCIQKTGNLKILYLDGSFPSFSKSFLKISRATYSLKVSQLTIWVAVPRRCHCDSPLVIKYGNGISSISSQL